MSIIDRKALNSILVPAIILKIADLNKKLLCDFSMLHCMLSRHEKQLDGSVVQQYCVHLPSMALDVACAEIFEDEAVLKSKRSRNG